MGSKNQEDFVCLVLNCIVYVALFATHLRLTHACSSRSPPTPKVVKISEGQDAQPNEFPFQVYFRGKDRPRCSGIILNENVVLTAAHCFDNYEQKERNWGVVAGDHNWENDAGTEQKRSIRRIHIHRYYKPLPHLFNDIALVYVNTPFIFNSIVKPAPLPEQNYVASGEAVVSGWGRKDAAGTLPDVLQKATVPIVPNEKCQKPNEYSFNKIICAGGGVQDACRGDSGGPLTVTVNGAQIVVGIVSAKPECGNTKKDGPGHYTRIAKYLNWIHSFSTEQSETECLHPGTRTDRLTSPNADCYCRVGYVKDWYGSTKCRTQDQDAHEKATLIWGSSKGIEQFSLEEYVNTGQLTHDGVIKVIDYHYKTKTIFWLSSWNDIYKGQVGKEEKASLLVRHSTTGYIFEAIAVDWVYNRLYYTAMSSFDRPILVSHLDGTKQKVIVGDNGKTLDITSIIVNPLNGWMYWADKYMRTIERSGMDGSRREVIATITGSKPYGLTLDLIANRLFYTTNTDPCSIYSMNTDGTDQKLVFKATKSTFSTSEFQSIAVFEDNVYWRDWSTAAVYVVNLDGEGFSKLRSDSKPYNLRAGVQVYHHSKQPEGHNYCVDRVNQCSHFCFPAPLIGTGPMTTTCACPDGGTLSSDNFNCL